jgi:hypothetical protein
MKVHQFWIIKESLQELEDILLARKNSPYDVSKPLKLAHPFDVDFTIDVIIRDVKMKISARLVAKFLYEAEEYYRDKIAAMGIEDVKYIAE